MNFSETEAACILDHQDWKKIILKKTKPKNKEQATITKVLDPNIKLEKKIEVGTMEHTKITIELRTKIQQGRSSKNLTQKQLANAVNLPVSVISEIESGRAIYNHVHINKIKRFLKVN
jgi:ribosome-binding protein aMBF1 (putative translation factor)|tara:strand:+ start:2230 stop:2583 length:354 start_codon:yes stop_codon:yes gene_type:complete